MNSSTHRRQEQEQEQAEIRKQIAALRAKLKDGHDNVELSDVQHTPKKRKQGLLAPRTPSPKKRRVLAVADASRPSATDSRPKPDTASRNHSLSASQPRPSAASTVLSKLADIESQGTNAQLETDHYRSSGFLQQAPPRPVGDDHASLNAKRDENLAIIEDLVPGPYEHTAPFDDPHFQKLEPHSGIRLSSRAIPHDEFQDYLRGRYYLSPSRLYSVVRILPNKQGYDIPVEGDWVTIAVVAERGQMKYTRAPVGVGKDEGSDLPDDDIKSLSLDQPANPAPPRYSNRWKGKAKEEPTKPSGKRYINLRLIDFGCRTKSSGSGEKSIIRGDACLSLLLFESDTIEEITHNDGRKEKLYKGGSRGAFERVSKLKEGSVLALLNPKILRPFQRSGDKPHPTDNVLALTPESIDTVAVIGNSQDLGMCTATKRDGKVCGSWCDKRVSEVCEWHIQHAIQHKRASRPEFSIGTSGMSAGSKRKPAYDPARQWGLKPEPDKDTSGATYMLSGHIVSSGSTDVRSMFVGENMGRDAQAKAARQTSTRDADATLQRLLKRDKEGSRAVAAAREHAKKLVEQQARESNKGKGKKGAVPREKKGKGSVKHAPLANEASGSESAEPETGKGAYSVSLIRTLGFDPTGKDGRNAENSDVQKKLTSLASVQASRKEIALGPRPGKLKSTVRAPDRPSGPAQIGDHASNVMSDTLVSLDEESDETLEREMDAFQRSTTKMVDLDASSDAELDLEPS